MAEETRDCAFLTGVDAATTRGLSSEAAETHAPSGLHSLQITSEDVKSQTQSRPSSAKSAFADRPGVETYSTWGNQAVSTFVTTSCDLPQYEHAIKTNNITGTHLREFRRHDMLNIGLQRAGICDHDHQRRISDEMLRVEYGQPDVERQRLSQTAQDWHSQNWKERTIQKHVKNRALWDVKRRELSFGRLTTCYMPGKKELDRGRFMYGPRLDLTRTAKLMKKEASCPAQLFSSETRKTMQLYDSQKEMSQRHSKMAGAAASSKGLVKVFD